MKTAGPALTASLLVATSCSLPPSQPPSVPKAEQLSKVLLSVADTGPHISYRDLTKSDFRALVPPQDFGGHPEVFGAVICARLATHPQTRVVALSPPHADEKTSYTGHIQELSFMATMDQSCSWWNQRNTPYVEPHLLQHEQIHFALHELGARDLNRRVEQMRLHFRHKADSAAEALTAAETFIHQVLHQAVTQVSERNERFDRETRFGTDRQRQLHWLDRIREELSATTPFTTKALSTR